MATPRDLAPNCLAGGKILLVFSARGAQRAVDQICAHLMLVSVDREVQIHICSGADLGDFGFAYGAQVAGEHRLDQPLLRCKELERIQRPR
ncbi:hypothetical protein AUR04nite_27710 [Glutamicibacter uratoxydans]|uniref:Uncharacterized protein n=1 Tax=Glutamicibacter uratoxydans TaxID=43667 RepID=A0A4Y4DPG5_GLUUR|nr:hypothetical protein AUR04nite_27710 [Glutamicibacter uratoxydans]